ncbi:MAG: ROK family transcriptional regulator, partial [Rhodospirillales bacterium]|nr:ROK family transcriptional regulator [Rhodospirillales bacterium]
MRNGIHAGTNVEQTRAYNRRAVLQAVRLHGPISRPELTDLTGLTAQTVNLITKDLIESDIITVTGARRGRRGHPAIEMQINPDGGYAIGVNLDQDRIVILLVDLQGTVHGRASLKTDFPPPETALPLIAENIAQLIGADPARDGKMLGIGMAVPGRLSLQQELVIPPSRLKAWNRIPIVSRLSEATGLPVILENDANAAAVGETLYGVSRLTEKRRSAGISFSASTSISILVSRGNMNHGNRAGIWVFTMA